VGYDADLVVWDPQKRLRLSQENLHMKVDYAAYPDKEVVGAPRTVLSRGETVIHDGKLLGKPGRGRFVKRDRFSL
jgi:dihydropyrimidinase